MSSPYSILIPIPNFSTNIGALVQPMSTEVAYTLYIYTVPTGEIGRGNRTHIGSSGFSTYLPSPYGKENFFLQKHTEHMGSFRTPIIFFSYVPLKV
jgi:hypothetical protein